MSTTSETPAPMKRQILKSVTYSALQFLSGMGLKVISTVVLTRLLAPDIYGVFAAVLIYRYLLEMLSDIGLRDVILTREGELDSRFLQTCWSVSILRGGLICTASVLIGISIYWLQGRGFFVEDSVYTDAALPLAIAALGGVAFLHGFLSMNYFRAEREMRFGHITISMVASSIIGLIATIALAYALRSVWALVIGAVVQTLFVVVYSHVFLSGPRMWPVLDRDAFRLIIARGKWVLGSSTMTAASHAADRLLLGFVINSATFGFYYLARQLLEITQGFLDKIHGQMGIQVFSHLLKAPENFRQNYYRYRLFFDIISCSAAGALYVLAPTIVSILFDDRYAEVAGIMQILIFALVFLGPYTLRESFKAELRFRTITIFTLISTVVLWGGLILSIFVLDSFTVALWFIALHRTPEIILLYIHAARRGWLVYWREAMLPVFLLFGAVLGWGTDYILVALLEPFVR